MVKNSNHLRLKHQEATSKSHQQLMATQNCEGYHQIKEAEKRGRPSPRSHICHRSKQISLGDKRPPLK